MEDVSNHLHSQLSMLIHVEHNAYSYIAFKPGIAPGTESQETYHVCVWLQHGDN